MKVTEQQIKEWKEKHGSIFKLTVEDKTCYLKTPGRKELSYASSVATKDPLKFNEILLNAAWLDGDPEIKTDDSLFLAAAGKLADIIVVKEAELEKL